MPRAKSFHQLIPPPEADPAVPAAASREQCVAMWLDLVEATDQILLSTLRSTLGSEAEARAAYRRCYEEQMREHDRTVRHMCEEFHRRWHARHGG